MRTLTQRELNRALLARQGLLERFDRSLPRCIESDRRPPDPVRAQRLHRGVVAAGGVRAWGAHAGAGARDGGAGHPDAQHDPHGLPSRLLADRHRGPGASAPVVAAGHTSCHERARPRNLGRPDPGCARRRPPTPIRAGEGARHGLHDLERCHGMARSGARAAERNLGAAKSRPLRLGGGLDRSPACGAHPGRRPRDPGSALPHGVRARLPQGHLELHRCAAPCGGCGARRDPHPAVPEPGGGTPGGPPRPARSPIPQPPCRCGSCPPGTPRCSSTRAGP